jgi:hypothetical protein
VLCPDHIQAEALSRALKLKTQIANLDGEYRAGDPITFAHLGEGNEVWPAITLLFRCVLRHATGDISLMVASTKGLVIMIS